jgi:hypothetical protein
MEDAMDQRRNTSTRRVRRAAFSLLLVAVATWVVLTFVESRERAWAQELEQQQVAQPPAHLAVPAIRDLFAAGLR